jgi:hypothetical protein
MFPAIPAAQSFRRDLRRLREALQGDVVETARGLKQQAECSPKRPSFRRIGKRPVVVANGRSQLYGEAATIGFLRNSSSSLSLIRKRSAGESGRSRDSMWAGNIGPASSLPVSGQSSRLSDTRSAVALPEGEQCGEPARLEAVIDIKQRDPFAAGNFKPTIARCARATVDHAAQQTHAVILRRDPRHHGGGGMGRGVGWLAAL